MLRSCFLLLGFCWAAAAFLEWEVREGGENWFGIAGVTSIKFIGAKNTRNRWFGMIVWNTRTAVPLHLVYDGKSLKNWRKRIYCFDYLSRTEFSDAICLELSARKSSLIGQHTGRKKAFRGKIGSNDVMFRWITTMMAFLHGKIVQRNFGPR